MAGRSMKPDDQVAARSELGATERTPPTIRTSAAAAPASRIPRRELHR